ncbi:hypothetical protein PENSUB_125 [Penicillium subrubescens]|uniref:Uncharacterized protein n=1 Tax=Penicillium subrubescens TaxID=1316194 RepID=A0A1Q5UNT9_9EURO|nr:hypothetical protein PENSUB_125 [Penicillium subrubescens]
MSKAGSSSVVINLSRTSTPRLRLPRLVDNSSIGDAEPDLTAPSILPKSKVFRKVISIVFLDSLGIIIQSIIQP